MSKSLTLGAKSIPVDGSTIADWTVATANTARALKRSIIWWDQCDSIWHSDDRSTSNCRSKLAEFCDEIDMIEASSHDWRDLSKSFGAKLTGGWKFRSRYLRIITGKGKINNWKQLFGFRHRTTGTVPVLLNLKLKPIQDYFSDKISSRNESLSPLCAFQLCSSEHKHRLTSFMRFNFNDTVLTTAEQRSFT